MKNFNVACISMAAHHFSALVISLAEYLQDSKVTEARNFNRFGTNFEGSPEPIYGSVFLPRKFKIAVTVPGDNSVDLFTNDLGIVVLTSPSGELQGYNIVVGGGMGRSHRQGSFPPLPFPGTQLRFQISPLFILFISIVPDLGARADVKKIQVSKSC